MMREEEMYVLPVLIKEELQTFMSIAAEDLPDKAIFKEMGLGSVVVNNIHDRIIKAFQLKG